MRTVSVIIPVYNVEPYLRQCIDSVLQQTYNDLEIILVDDGSPDNCPAICDEYAQKDARVKVVHKKNGGISCARNAGIDVATGEYICFFDSDDYIEVDMIERLLSAIEENHDDVCVCGYSVDTHNELGIEVSKKDAIPPYCNISQQLSLNECECVLGICGYVWNKLYRRAFIQKYNLKFEERISLWEDLLFNAAMFNYGAKVVFLPYAGYHYIQRKRETLGVKYYENFFELKQRAIDAKCSILKTWGIEKERIIQFYNDNYIDALWGTIKNIKRSCLSKQAKRVKIVALMKDKQMRQKLQKINPHNKTRKMKRLLLARVPVKLLLKILK